MKNTVTAEQVNEIMERAKVECVTLYGKTTVVAVQLENGFVIVESSSCVAPENYNMKIGFDICMNRIMNKVWELEGYKLQSELNSPVSDADFEEIDKDGE